MNDEQNIPSVDDGPALVAAFLARPINSALRSLSKFGEIEKPRFKIREGISTPEEIAKAWSEGFNGRAVTQAFYKLLESEPSLWPEREGSKPPPARSIELFEDLPEIAEAIRTACEAGEAIHHIRSYITAMKKMWSELEQSRPRTWSAEDVVSVLRRRHLVGVGSVQYPLAGVRYLWIGQNTKYAKGELSRFIKLLEFGASLCVKKKKRR